jgi:hypothetical protein
MGDKRKLDEILVAGNKDNWEKWNIERVARWIVENYEGEELIKAIAHFAEKKRSTKGSDDCSPNAWTQESS